MEPLAVAWNEATMMWTILAEAEECRALAPKSEWFPYCDAWMMSYHVFVRRSMFRHRYDCWVMILSSLLLLVGCYDMSKNFTRTFWTAALSLQPFQSASCSSVSLCRVLLKPTGQTSTSEVPIKKMCVWVWSIMQRRSTSKCRKVTFWKNQIVSSCRTVAPASTWSSLCAVWY